MTSGSAGRLRAIESALLDYHRTPGKFALIRKQPELLFDSMKEVLQLAAGRSPDAAESGAPTAAIQNAARFFIQAALLYPGADHYSLLGLQRQANAAAIKDRYRLMMRLMHPDFSSALPRATWPADAATRVNRAYEVLASAVQRRQYDASLDTSQPQTTAPRPPRAEVRTAMVKVAPPTSVAQDRRRGLKSLAALFGAAGAVVLLAIFLVNTNDKETLVQRGEVVAPPTAVTLKSQPIAPLPVVRDATAMLPNEATSTTRSTSLPPASLAVAVAPAIQSLPISRPLQIAPIAPAIDTPRVPSTPSFAPTPALVPMPMSAPVAISPVATPSIAIAPAAIEPAPAAAPVRSATPVAAPNPGVTLAEVHPLLSKLLQQIETGSGDRVLSMLDRNARGAPDAQALLRYFNSVADGSRPVKLSNVQFKAVPRDGYLSVTGHVRMHVGLQPSASAGTDFSLQADFAARDGTVVMTRLARAADN